MSTTQIQVVAKPDFFKALSTDKPISAIAELVWNGFDAFADSVSVFIDENGLGGIEQIRIQDDGMGIPHSKVSEFFGNLGDSWKKSKGRVNGRALHGKSGKGRFQAFALGTFVEWETIFRDEDGHLQSYSIQGKTEFPGKFIVSQPTELDAPVKTGTKVIISNILKNFRSLKLESTPLELAKIFGAYLTEYPDLRFEYEGKNVNPQDVRIGKEDYSIGDIVLTNNRKASMSLTIIEWNFQSSRALYLCDANGIALHEILAGQQIKAPDFNFTAYIKSDYFRELDKEERLILEELDTGAQIIIKAAKDKIKEHFRRKLLFGKTKTVERWKEENIYPYEEKEEEAMDSVELAERQVFDILAVNVENYLPSFENIDTKSKKFTFSLLAQAVRENPESVQRIITEVLGLKKDEQDEFAELLKKVQLSSIINSAKIVANRLDFLFGLEELVFEKESKKNLLERDQLHRVLEKESWIFDESFALAGSEIGLEEVLNKHVKHLGAREDEEDPVNLPDGKRGRIDLLLHKATKPREGEYDYLIVELKRPSKKIDSLVLAQIKKYAMAVASDERFKGVPASWKFIAISNDFDTFAEKEASQKNRPRGLVYDDSEQNITVWIKTWAEVINDARARINFFKERLSYEVDFESSIEYLKKVHEKFIPSSVDEEIIETSQEEVSPEEISPIPEKIENENTQPK